MVHSHLNRNISRVFVGRQQELAELSAALDDAMSGQGRLAKDVWPCLPENRESARPAPPKS